MDEKTFTAKVAAKRDEIAAKPETVKALLAATPEEAKAITTEVLKKAKAAVKQEERDEALKLVLDTISAVAADDAAIMSAVAILRRETRHSTPGLSIGRTAGPSIVDKLFAEVGDTADEATLFAEAKYGRGDGRRMIQHAVKDAKDASSRKWISFDVETGIYKLEAVGANPPDGWTGYLPVSMATDKAAATDVSKPAPAKPAPAAAKHVPQKMF